MLAPLLKVHRPYRIPIPDWAAVLLAIPPVFGIIVIFLISNWYVCIFNVSSIALGYGLVLLGELSIEKEWFSCRMDNLCCQELATIDEESTEGVSTTPYIIV
jgi:hypothetical protein